MYLLGPLVQHILTFIHLVDRFIQIDLHVGEHITLYQHPKQCCLQSQATRRIKAGASKGENEQYFLLDTRHLLGSQINAEPVFWKL